MLQIYQAHVTDKCADIFRVVVRKYNPPVKGARARCIRVDRRALVLTLHPFCVVENMEEIDQEALDRVAELEKIVKAKEAAVKKLRASVGHRPVVVRVDVLVDATCLCLPPQIPKAAAEKMRQRLEKERKRKLEVVVTYVAWMSLSDP